jgi:hypothetical protein
LYHDCRLAQDLVSLIEDVADLIGPRLLRGLELNRISLLDVGVGDIAARFLIRSGNGDIVAFISRSLPRNGNLGIRCGGGRGSDCGINLLDLDGGLGQQLVILSKDIPDLVGPRFGRRLEL